MLHVCLKYNNNNFCVLSKNNLYKTNFILNIYYKTLITIIAWLPWAMYPFQNRDETYSTDTVYNDSGLHSKFNTVRFSVCYEALTVSE